MQWPSQMLLGRCRTSVSSDMYIEKERLSSQSKGAHHVCKVVEEFGGFLTVSASEFKQLRRPLNEGSCCLATEELRVPQNVVQEIDVCFHAPDVELKQSPLHLLDGGDVGAALHNDLQKVKQLSWERRDECRLRVAGRRMILQ